MFLLYAHHVTPFLWFVNIRKFICYSNKMEIVHENEIAFAIDYVKFVQFNLG